MDPFLAVDEHTPWACRWTCLAQRSRGKQQAQADNVFWVCIRGRSRRPVTDSECEACEFWEPEGPDALD